MHAQHFNLVIMGLVKGDCIIIMNPTLNVFEGWVTLD